MALKLTYSVFEVYKVLFGGLETVIMGGIVPGIGSTDVKIKNAFAFASLTASNPAASENKSDETSITANAVLFMLSFPLKCTNTTFTELKEKDFYQETLTNTPQFE